MNAIGWCHQTVNLVVGCLNNCDGGEWCYARKRAHRVAHQMQGVFEKTGKGPGFCQDCHDFRPHIHPERLAQISRKRRSPVVMFVGSMCDFWSDGVPQEWRDRMFSQMMGAQARGLPVDFVVLTKRPQEFTAQDGWWFRCFTHLWVGVSVTGPEDMHRYVTLCESVPQARVILSVEPLLAYGPEIAERFPPPAWAIVGPQTPVRRPNPETGKGVKKAVAFWQRCGVPVFVKPSAAKAWPGVPLVQEWPEEMFFKPTSGGEQ